VNVYAITVCSLSHRARRVLLGTLLVCGIGSFVTGCAVKARDGPAITFDRTEFTGEPIDGHVRHRFEFRNTGTRRLTITDVISGCGCMVAYPKELELEPGSESWIDADMTAPLGRREAVLSVRSNDVQKPVTLLTLISGGSDADVLDFVPQVVHCQNKVPCLINCLVRLTRWKKSDSVTAQELQSLLLDAQSSLGYKAAIRRMEAEVGLRKFALRGAVNVSLPDGSQWINIADVPGVVTWMVPLEISLEPRNEITSDIVLQACMTVKNRPLSAELRISASR
jgi:Protein of unknown function (DUF1573)